MESRSAPLTSYHAKPSNHMEIVEPPLVCSLPCGTGDLSGIHSCSSEAHDVLGAVIEMPHLRGRDVDILLGQPWTHETEPTSGSWSSKPQKNNHHHKCPWRTKLTGPCGLKTSPIFPCHACFESDIEPMYFLSSQLL